MEQPQDSKQNGSDFRAMRPPTPAETVTCSAAALEELVQQKRNPGARALNSFLKDVAGRITRKGDVRTNIIDQGARITYALEDEEVPRLLAHLETCRREKSALHFSERQGTPERPKSGIMLDYDLLLDSKPATGAPAISDRLYNRIVGRVIGQLQQHLILSEPEPEGDNTPGGGGGSGGHGDVNIHVFCTEKSSATPVTLPGKQRQYRYGFHVLVPGVQVERGYKKYLLRALQKDQAITAALRDLGVIGDLTEALDMNSASVPVLFLGSCKRGGAPYSLAAAYRVTIDTSYDGAYPMIQKLSEDDLRGYNLVHETSLNYSAMAGESGHNGPLVVKRKYACRPDIEAQIEDVADRTHKGLIDPGELLLTEHCLSTLTLHDPEAAYLHQLLDLLDEGYYTERNRWRDVIFALANTSDQYKPLAEWFSQKCPDKWIEGGAASLDELWADAGKRALTRPLSKRSLIHWARECSPKRFQEIVERNYFSILLKFVYKYGGVLEHFMIGKVIYAMLGSKFVVDVVPGLGARGHDGYSWFEFVIPGQSMRPGEVWKWRREAEPDEVRLYISEHLPKVLEQVADHIEERREGAEDEENAKYYKNLGKQFAISRRKLFNNTFKNGVIREAYALFRRRGFYEELDRAGDLLGCGNGVLCLGGKCRLIDHFHEHPVSRCTRVPYRPFDPEAPDPWQQLILDAIADIIPEPDAREKILFHLSTGLAGGYKEAQMLLWEGGGNNGKTFLLMLWKNTLGDDYSTKLPSQLLSDERESANSPNSALMRVKFRRGVFFEESNKSVAINPARLKEMVNPGEISASEKHMQQESFMVEATYVNASNYSFIFNTTDHGTWRRVLHYTSKVRFCLSPDSANPYEKKEDARFARQYVNDPDCQAAFLGILAYYYERLQKEFRGEVKRVPCPTIERETERFRNSQDAINRFVTEMVVKQPEPQGAEARGPLDAPPTTHCEYRLDVVGSRYMDWFNSNIERKRHVAAEVMKDLENSALQKHLRRATNGSTLVLSGCRILDPTQPGGMELQAGEEFLSAPANEAAENDDSLRRWLREGASQRWWAGPQSKASDARAPPGADDPFLDDFIRRDEEQIRTANKQARAAVSASNKEEEVAMPEQQPAADDALVELLCSVEAEDNGYGFEDLYGSS